MNCVVSMIPALSVLALANFSASSSAVAADASFYGILKSQQFIQNSANAPVALATGGFAFNSAVLLNTPGSVTSATIEPPNATPARALVPDPSGNALRYEERFNTQAQLDAAYPNGGLTASYLMTLETVNDGIQSADLNFTVFGLPLGSPPTVRVTTFAAAQSIDHSAEFTLRWTATGAQVVDQIQLVIIDASSNAVFTSPAPFSAGALTGASNHMVLPPYTFPPDATLIGHLAIARPGVPNTDSYPGALGVAGIVRDTQFPLQTRPAPAAPQLEIMTPPAGDSPIRLRITGESNRVYRLQATGNFSTWNDLLTTNSASGSVEFTDPNSLVFPGRAYRAALGREPNP